MTKQKTPEEAQASAPVPWQTLKASKPTKDSPFSLEDLYRLATGWITNAQSFDQAFNPNSARHGGSCQCHPCRIARRIVKFSIEMSQTQEAHHSKGNGLSLEGTGDPPDTQRSTPSTKKKRRKKAQ